MKAYAQVVVFGVILCFLQESSCDYRTNNEIDSNSREIKKMNRKLDILTNEVRKLKEESPNEGDIFAEYPFPVTLLSARREVTEEGVVYTVRYATDRRVREKVVWEVDDDDDDFSREIISNSIPVYNRGFQETKFLTRNGTHSYVSLYISTETSWLSITLENNGQGNLTTRIETPKMIVEPTSRDLSYEVGENATFTVTTARNEDVNWRGPPGGMPGRRSYITARLVDLDTLTLIPYEISDGMYEKVEERQYFDYVEQVYAINTADY
ncbi:uncharacterized protein LOC101862935, partial [Aplysia californica]|uniref:Uncharacterized protein LOC101862935 n=1 Tax=Aplysia californica TaxID=6500 RepID=A0ABM0ZXB9_APLCA